MVGLSINTGGRPTPYITVQELKRSPVYTQLKSLVPGSSDADRDAELGRIIMRASSMINSEVQQNLVASIDVEAGPLIVTSGGDLRIHVRCNPIIEVLSLSIGNDPGNLIPVTDLSSLFFEPWRILLPQTASSIGNLPSVTRIPGRRLWAQWTYINGWPSTTFAAPTAIGDTTITVMDATGIKAGQTQLTIEDGKWLEEVVPSVVSGNVLTVPPLLYPHQQGTGIGSMPSTIKEATLLLVSRLHDTWSLTMNAVSTDGNGARKNVAAPRIMCDAGYMLSSFRRMV